MLSARVRKMCAAADVEVFEVGALQARELLDWEWRGNSKCRFTIAAQTMRKGAWIAVYSFCSFGRWSFGRNIMCIGDGTLRDALGFARVIMHRGPADRVLSEVEIWHLVDDYELWCDWEISAAIHAHDDVCDGPLVEDVYVLAVCEDERVVEEKYFATESERSDSMDGYVYCNAELFDCSDVDDAGNEVLYLYHVDYVLREGVADSSFVRVG